MIYLDSAATTLRKPPSVARACAYAIDHLATPAGAAPARHGGGGDGLCLPPGGGRPLTCLSRTGWSLPSTPPTA